MNIQRVALGLAAAALGASAEPASALVNIPLGAISQTAGYSQTLVTPGLGVSVPPLSAFTKSNVAFTEDLDFQITRTIPSSGPPSFPANDPITVDFEMSPQLNKSLIFGTVSGVGPSATTTASLGLYKVGDLTALQQVNLSVDAIDPPKYHYGESAFLDYTSALTPGSYFVQLTGLYQPLSSVAAQYDMTLDIAQAVPEVSTWAMMLAGFACLGWVGFSRRRSGMTRLAA
jgi:hypothetical protein